MTTPFMYIGVTTLENRKSGIDLYFQKSGPVNSFLQLLMYSTVLLNHVEAAVLVAGRYQ
jgi:hypothetical protein